jgi:hypothetical protein
MFRNEVLPTFFYPITVQIPIPEGRFYYAVAVD